MTSRDVMIGMTRNGGPFCRRRWLCVPNVYWGWGLAYEADLIAISKAGKAYEIEIKISKSDFKNDAKKHKWKSGLHTNISKFYYAVPFYLEEFAAENIREGAGLIVVSSGNKSTSGLPTAIIKKPATKIKNATDPTPHRIQELQRLGVMRFWDLLIKDAK